jgi:hypothetical protein
VTILVQEAGVGTIIFGGNVTVAGGALALGEHELEMTINKTNVKNFFI